jgi:uncharacterized protein
VRRFLLDTGIFLYAIGSEHHYRQPCQAILRELQAGRLAGEASIELIHEFSYVRARRDSRVGAAHLARRIERSCPLHAVNRADVERALDLWCEHERLDMRDAIFAAQALNRGIDAILSPDHGFDEVPELERIDPADAEAVAAWAAR